MRLCATRKGTSASSGTCKLPSTVGHKAGEFSAFCLLCNCLQLWDVIFFSLLALSSSSTEVIIIVLSMCSVRCHCQSLYILWVILNRISVSPAPALPVLCGRLELRFGEVVISVMCLDHPLVLGLWNSNNICPLRLFKENQWKQKVDWSTWTAVHKRSKRLYHHINSLWVMEQGRRKSSDVRQSLTIRPLVISRDLKDENLSGAQSVMWHRTHLSAWGTLPSRMPQWEHRGWHQLWDCICCCRLQSGSWKDGWKEWIPSENKQNKIKSVAHTSVYTSNYKFR